MKRNGACPGPGYVTRAWAVAKRSESEPGGYRGGTISQKGYPPGGTLNCPRQRPCAAQGPNSGKTRLFFVNTKILIFMQNVRWEASGASPEPPGRGLCVSNVCLGRTWARALELQRKKEGPGGPSFPSCPQIWLGILNENGCMIYLKNGRWREHPASLGPKGPPEGR